MPGDMLMMLDDDHAYVPDALGRAEFDASFDDYK